MPISPWDGACFPLVQHINSKDSLLYDPSLSNSNLFVMTLLSNISPPLIQEALSQQMSVLDLFLPGFSNITSAASHVLSGNWTSYTHLVCIFALAAFLKPYVFELRYWFLEHFSKPLKMNL